MLSRLHLSVFGALTRPLSRNMTWWVETAERRVDTGHITAIRVLLSHRYLLIHKYTQYSEELMFVVEQTY